MLRIQILFQGFGDLNSHIWCKDMERRFFKKILNERFFLVRHGDTYDISCDIVFFDNLSYFVG